MNKTSFLMLRVAIGTSMFGHGLVRLPKLAAFSNWMMTSFQKSFLPKALVLPFSFALPFVEFLVGILLLIGLFTKQALMAGALVMIVLLFGTTTIESWDAIPVQLIHVAFFATLLHYISANSYAFDNMVRKNTTFSAQ